MLLTYLNRPLAATAIWSFLALSVNSNPIETRAQCRQTKVAVLGAGVAGITAAQSLSNNSITDFVIIEYNADIGGRMIHVPFGKNQTDNSSFTVELGANWVQGLGAPGGPQNPIWTLVQKYNVTNTYSNYSSIITYDDTGAHDYSSLLNQYSNAYNVFQADAGILLNKSLQDRSARAGLTLSGWRPTDMRMRAVEWWNWDWEYAYQPELSSQIFGVVNYNTSFYQFSNQNNYVWDQRGFNTWLKGEASTFLSQNDPRLLLNTVVHNVAYNDRGVTVYSQDGRCIQADYAICTFSLGVLQHDAIQFEPPLPRWKQEGIATFAMGTYTKIFLQFPPDKIFWDKSTQYFLYADPTTRGYYPIWQSLDSPGFLEGSGIFFVTVVQDESYRVELQSDEQTKQEVLEVLRKMFGANKVPDPIDFMYPRWTLETWAYGSYSNWPAGVSLEMHENLRANVSRLYFAGEATSTEYYGFLQGAWFEGQLAGRDVASCVKGHCAGRRHYAQLPGSTSPGDYNLQNGWMVSSFQTNGLS